MNDLISRQDALKALDEMSYKSPHESATSVVRKKHFEEILEKFIMQQPSAQQWIPCSERLPEEGQEVLFSTKTGTVQIGKYSDRGCLNSWFSYCDKCRAWNNVVNAWMPLPEPFKDKYEED